MSANPIYAEFYPHPVLQVAESNEKDREIYKDEVYVTLRVKGQRNFAHSRKAKEQDKYDFPEAWAAYIEDNPQIGGVGTPVKFLPGVDRSTEMLLRGYGIFMVEDLIEIDDAILMDIRGGSDLKRRARAYMAAAEVKTAKKPQLESVDEVIVEDDESLVPAPARKRGRPQKAT